MREQVKRLNVRKLVTTLGEGAEVTGQCHRVACDVHDRARGKRGKVRDDVLASTRTRRVNNDDAIAQKVVARANRGTGVKWGLLFLAGLAGSFVFVHPMGIAGIAIMLGVALGLPVGFAVLAWAIAGFGIAEQWAAVPGQTMICIRMEQIQTYGGEYYERYER